MDSEGYYARLGVTPDAPPSAIAAAYRAKARVLHPDVPGTGDAGAFILLHEAYEVLGDEFSRARYDRASRDHSRRQPAPKWSEPPPPPPMPQLPAFLLSPVTRFFLWTSLIVLTAVSVGELAIHVVRLVQAPLPARLASITQEQLMPAPAAPLQTTGTPTHYVLPTGGPAPLWRYDADQQRYLPAAHLEPFSGVAVLDTPERDGMVEVRVTDGQGFIDATRLAPGGTKAARAAYCSYNAGPPLLPSEIMIRHGHGDAALRIDNTNAEPVVLKLRDPQGTTALSVFVPQGTTRIANLPVGRYAADYATGTLWSRACGSFIAGERTWRLPYEVALSNGEARIVVPNTNATETPPDSFAND